MKCIKCYGDYPSVSVGNLLCLTCGAYVCKEYHTGPDGKGTCQGCGSHHEALSSTALCVICYGMFLAYSKMGYLYTWQEALE